MEKHRPGPLHSGFETALVAGVVNLPEAEWDALVDVHDPFLEHRFLAALEISGSVGGASGWEPVFVVARQGGRLVAALPLYLKRHSMGEFIFDWGWANAAHRAGLTYYPKLVAAVPFTPATGRRLLVAEDVDREAAAEALVTEARALMTAVEASSIHVLFCREDETHLLARFGFRPRLSMQFHWHNRVPDPFADFDDFLSTFRSRNRKQVKKERSLAAGHGLRLATVEGVDMGETEWRALERFYALNAAKHDAFSYLTPEFFRLLRGRLRERVVATFAYRGDEPIAGTLNFERGGHLYGRYWGAEEELPMLHFELCYYQLIERAIARRHTRFEAGAQGEHKLKRGLLPAFTHSAHLIAHPGLAAGVYRFLEAESAAVARDHQAYGELAPTRAGDDP